MILNIFIIAFLIIIILILILYIWSDVIKSKEYKNSMIVQGIICEYQGKEVVKNYGKYTFRNYGKYLVKFTLNDKEFTRSILLRKAKLKIGNKVELHYIIRDNKVEILNDISYRRLKELKIAFLIAIPLCAILIYLNL